MQKLFFLMAFCAFFCVACEDDDEDLTPPPCTKNVCDGSFLYVCHEDGTTTTQDCDPQKCVEKDNIAQCGE